MAKRIRMTFHAKEWDELSIIDDVEKITTLTDVAAYMIEHAEGFKSYSVELLPDEVEE